MGKIKWGNHGNLYSSHYDLVKSLWSSDAIWWYKSGSAFPQVMACCLMVPSHYLNQDLPSNVFCGIHLRAISQWVPKLQFCVISFKIVLVKLLPHLPGTCELTCLTVPTSPKAPQCGRVMMRLMLVQSMICVSLGYCSAMPWYHYVI